jgi:hypothetical protein
MSEQWWDINQVAKYLGTTITGARAALSRAKIKVKYVYPGSEVEKITRPGRGRRTDLHD